MSAHRGTEPALSGTATRRWPVRLRAHGGRPGKAGRRWASALLAGLTAASLLACGSQTPERPAQPTAPLASGLPLAPDQQAEARRLAVMRGWDYCAMHDLPAAEQITSSSPTSLHPYLGLDDCKLVLRQRDGTEWELTLGVEVADPMRGSTPLKIGNVQLPQVGISPSDNECAYSYPLSTVGKLPLGIEINAHSFSPTKPICDVARDYARAVLPKLADPPTRDAGLTTPRLALAALDPCAVVAEVMPALTGGAELTPRNTQVQLGEPYKCEATWTDDKRSSGARNTRARVAAELDTEAGGPQATTTTVGGRPAEVTQQTLWCRVTARATDFALSTDPTSKPYVEVLKLELPSCPAAVEQAERAVKLVKPAPPAPPNAQRIGDLNPPPSVSAAGAPFDPCVVPGWDAYPARLRPQPGSKPTAAPVAKDDPFKVACKYNYRGLFSMVVWGPESGRFTANPSARAGSTPMRFGTKPGIESRGINAGNKQPLCYSAVALSNGIAAISTTYATDPCAVNRSVLGALSAKVG